MLLVEALCYKLEGHGFDSLWCHWNLHSPSGCTMALGSTQPLTEREPGIFPGGCLGLCLRLASVPPSGADCHEI